MVRKITARGFGAKYGKSVREKFGKMESKQRKRQECPFCKRTAKRISNGIWECKICGKRFASGTYYIE
jgi:large subunit ribosomal protein L37Ae